MFLVQIFGHLYLLGTSAIYNLLPLTLESDKSGTLSINVKLCTRFEISSRYYRIRGGFSCRCDQQLTCLVSLLKICDIMEATILFFVLKYEGLIVLPDMTNFCLNYESRNLVSCCSHLRANPHR